MTLLRTLLGRGGISSGDPASGTVEAALVDAERKGFQLAVIGRTCALIAFALFYLAAVTPPNNVLVAGAVMVGAGIGLAPLALVGGPYERIGRYALFAFDAWVVSTIIALAPLSGGGDVPQNLVFLSGRPGYYFVVVAVSFLTLSPGLVLWTGFCSVVGLAGALAWIMAGMERVVSLRDLPPSASREVYMDVVLDADFVGIAYRVSEGVVLVVVTCMAALAVHRARQLTRAHAAGEAERTRIHRIFGRYVPAQVAGQLLDEGWLAPQQREASIVFADIEGFTRLSESLPPARVIELLNGFFGAASTVIDTHGGVVVNHVGDALIASFNAPLPAAGHAARAVDAARALVALVAEQMFEGHRLRLRIGVATGPVAAGTVGATDRQTYTLYGDTVNLAQRLEELNKELGTDCLISGTTFEAARAACGDVATIGPLQVRGRDRLVEVFALKA